MRVTPLVRHARPPSPVPAVCRARTARTGRARAEPECAGRGDSGAGFRQDCGDAGAPLPGPVRAGTGTAACCFTPTGKQLAELRVLGAA